MLLKKTTTRITNLASALAVVTILVACGQSRETPAAAAPEGAATGKAIYDSRCQFCHGPLGAGDTPMSNGYPNANLVDSTWAHGDGVGEIAKTIGDGVPGTPMAGFNGRLKPEEIRAVAEYVKSLGK